MGFLLGNLNIQEMENRMGIKFPKKLVDFMESRRQQRAFNIAPGKWHCFDAPFNLVCGDIDTALEIYLHLRPMAHKLKQQIQISIQN